MLDETFDWPLEDPRMDSDYGPNLCPSAYPPRTRNAPRKYTPKTRPKKKKTGEVDISDHAELMALDPVDCLFEKTQLAHRLSWLLAPSRRLHARLSADAAGVWLPNLLLRGVRHSLRLASQVPPRVPLYFSSFPQK